MEEKTHFYILLENLNIIIFRVHGWPVFGAVNDFEPPNMIIKNLN